MMLVMGYASVSSARKKASMGARCSGNRRVAWRRSMESHRERIGECPRSSIITEPLGDCEFISFAELVSAIFTPVFFPPDSAKDSLGYPGPNGKTRHPSLPAVGGDALAAEPISPFPLAITGTKGVVSGVLVIGSGVAIIFFDFKI